MNGLGVPLFKGHLALGDIMQAEGFNMGIELGVPLGAYAHAMLTR
jgi:hypothetical protein